MREILFRGKRIDNGEWVEGNLAVDKDHCYICQAISDFGVSYGDNGTRMRIGCWFPVDPSTVGQYTGLKDKNGKRIFEGDIVKYGTRILSVWWNGEMFQWQAKEKDAFGIYSGKIDDTDWTNIDLGWIAAEIACIGRMTTEIIGNIHDNPELIGGNDEANI